MPFSKNTLLLVIGIFFAIGFLAIRLIPPFASPDENVHLLRAEMLSQGHFFLKTPPENTPEILNGSGGVVDKEFLFFSIQSLRWIFSNETFASEIFSATSPEMPTSLNHLRQLGQDTNWSGNLIFVPVVGTGYYNPVIYIPHATALWLGKQLKLSVMATHDLTRVMLMTLCAFFCAKGLREVAFPMVALAILSIPMTIFQWYSPTIDGLSLSLTVYTLSLFLKEATSIAPPSSKRMILVSILTLIIVTTRIHMLPLLALPVFLAWRQATKKAWALVFFIISSSAFWITFAIRTTVENRVTRSHTTIEIAKNYLLHPLEFTNLLWRTISDENLSHFYFQSFIGNLGWLDTPIPSTHTTLLCLGLFFFLGISIISLTNQSKSITPGIISLLLSTALTSIALAFAALAITWNDYPTKTIGGMQGRYFTLPLFLAACTLYNHKEIESPRDFFSKKINLLGAAALIIYFFYSNYITFSTLNFRF